MVRKSYRLHGGLGDVIAGMGIFEIEKLKDRSIYTTCYLTTHCDASNLLQYNPNIDQLVQLPVWGKDSNYISLQNEAIIKSDPAFVGQELYLLSEHPYPTFFISLQDRDRVIDILGGITKLVIFHQFESLWAAQAGHRKTKNMPDQLWQLLADYLIDCGYTIAVVGSSKDKISLPPSSNVLNLLGRTSLREVVELVNRSAAVIAIDSFIKSVALALKKPTVVVINDSEDYARDNLFLVQPYRENPLNLFLTASYDCKQDALAAMSHLRTIL